MKTTGKRALLSNWKEMESLSATHLARRLEQGYKFFDNFVLILWMRGGRNEELGMRNEE
jgi:hypothetical protein